MVEVCPLLPGHESPIDQIRLLDSEQLTAEEKLSTRRALRNLKPDSKLLYECVDASAKTLFYEVDCAGYRDRPNTVCNCSTDSDLRRFYDLFKSKPTFTKDELQDFVDEIQCAFEREMVRRSRGFDYRKCKRRIAACDLGPLELFEKESKSSQEYVCSCKSSNTLSNTSSTETLECWDCYLAQGLCKNRNKPVASFGQLLNVPSADDDNTTVTPFVISEIGKSDEIGKWGRFHDMVWLVLVKNALRKYQRFYEDNVRMSWDISGSVCCDDVCVMPPRNDDRFDDIDRFEGIENFGLSTFCRHLMRWSNCTTKRWECVTCHPHQVIHLPSLSYPRNIRTAAHKKFVHIQNNQIGRLGWLVNKQAQVVYVCPGASNHETERTLRNFVSIARPDVCLANLLIIVNDEECPLDNADNIYRSGCERLFFAPSIYRRVRRLTAGRRSFILPGVLCRTVVLIACELRTPVIGPCLNLQQRLFSKHYVMTLLNESDIRHPPFAQVRNYDDLCDTMTRMIIGLDWRVGRRKFLLKVNCGFCGQQTARICLEREEYCHVNEENLLRLRLADTLLQKIQINRKAYNNVKDFFAEIERHGGILTQCPCAATCRTVSLGCFIEHDTADAKLRAAADVLQSSSSSSSLADNVGYVMPQSCLPINVLLELVKKLGRVMMLEQYIGYYGVDLVVFRDEDSGELNYWVVDINPNYTDLISFDDWRRFCLDIPITADFDVVKFPRNDRVCNISSKNDDQRQRYVVCSGKLFVDGLTERSGNFLVDICHEHNIAYSSKARAGCMMCPTDNEKRCFLLFAFCREKQMALRYFVRGLRALDSASLEGRRRKKKKSSLLPKSSIGKFACDIVDMFKIDGLD